MTENNFSMVYAEQAEEARKAAYRALEYYSDRYEGLLAELVRVKAKSEERKAILESISVGDACGWCGTIQIFRRGDTERKPQHRDDCPLAKALED